MELDRVYRIAKWDEVFERAESRKLKHLTWVAMPIGFGSNGYQCLLEEFEEDAAAVYGAWCALVAVAAGYPRRGILASSRGIPPKISHIARRSGLPAAQFRRLIAWATKPEVGWLEPVSEAEMKEMYGENIEIPRENIASGESPDDPPTIPQNPPATVHNSTEHNSTGHNTHPTPDPPSGVLPASAGGVCVPPPGEVTSEGESEPPGGDKAAVKEFARAVIDAWNDRMLKNCQLTKSRMAVLRARYRDKHWRENWHRAIDMVAESDFCKGVNDSGWKAELDWFLEPKNFTKVLDGNYRNRAGRAPPSKAQSQLQAMAEVGRRFIEGGSKPVANVKGYANAG